MSSLLSFDDEGIDDMLFDFLGGKKVEKNKQQLTRTMTSRHITMMALGGAIGAGLFKGSSAAIDMAGPSVLIAYLIGGIMLLFVMQGLAEMAVRNKEARTFRDLVQSVLGKYPAYFLDWIYWKMWVLNIAAESVVAAIFIQYWLPKYPIWILALSVSVLVTAINLLSVKIFAETEYWLALIKITVIIVFIIAGLILLLVTFGNHSAVGFANLTEHGGFFPNGSTGLIAAMLVVIYSYGGTEIIGITLAETKNPEKVVPKAVRSTLVRILMCTLAMYLGVILSLYAGSKTFDFLMGSLGYTVLFIWLIIAIAHLKSRKKQAEHTSAYEVKWFPYTTWVAILALSAILIGIIFTTSIIVTGITLAIYLFITLTYVLKGRYQAN